MQKDKNNHMKNLSNFHIMALYLLAWQLGEGANEDIQNKAIPAIDHLLTINGHKATTEILYDDDGGPLNATAEVYKEFNDWLDNQADDQDYEIISLDEIHKTQAFGGPEYLYSLLMPTQ